MKFQLLLISLCYVLFVYAAPDDVLKNCIKNKVANSLGDEFNVCYNTSRALFFPRIKKCTTDSFIKLDITRVQPNGNYFVDRQALKQYGVSNNSPVALAARQCSMMMDPSFYSEAARVSQCIFSEIKKSCQL